MIEEHTIWVTLNLAGKEWGIELDVKALYCPGWPATRDDEEEVEHYEVQDIKLSHYSEELAKVIAAEMLEELDGKAIEAAEARRDELMERLGFPVLERAS